VTGATSATDSGAAYGIISMTIGGIGYKSGPTLIYIDIHVNQTILKDRSLTNQGSIVLTLPANKIKTEATPAALAAKNETNLSVETRTSEKDNVWIEADVGGLIENAKNNSVSRNSLAEAPAIVSILSDQNSLIDEEKSHILRVLSGSDLSHQDQPSHFRK